MRIHIISFDVPLPANYGGVIDVFYKIKALHKAGIKIKLHCFYYGREKNVELEKEKTKHIEIFLDNLKLKLELFKLSINISSQAV